MAEKSLRNEASGGRSRALVVRVSPGQRDADRISPLAQFIAQIIACERRLPEYRRARKAEPAEARGAYLGGGSYLSRRVDLVV